MAAMREAHEEWLLPGSSQAAADCRQAAATHRINGVCYYTMYRNLTFLDEFAAAADEVWGTG